MSWKHRPEVSSARHHPVRGERHTRAGACCMAGFWPLASGLWPLASGLWPLASVLWPLVARRWAPSSRRGSQPVPFSCGDRIRMQVAYSCLWAQHIWCVHRLSMQCVHCSCECFACSECCACGILSVKTTSPHRCCVHSRSLHSSPPLSLPSSLFSSFPLLFACSCAQRGAVRVQDVSVLARCRGTGGVGLLLSLHALAQHPSDPLRLAGRTASSC